MTPSEQRELELRRDADIRHVMDSTQGRRFVLRLVEVVSRAYSASYEADTHATAYREGQRSVGLAIAEEVKRLAPEAWVKGLAEAFAEELDRRRKHDVELR